MKYMVRYHECYEGYYEVEADSKEEAEGKLLNDIWTGNENPPEECYESDAVVTDVLEE